MKIYPLGSELFHAGRQTHGWTDKKVDVTKLIVVLSKPVNVPKNGKDCIIFIEIRIMFCQKVPL
jgi:hypothetical protein